ncbi:DUF4928 domain-containing protein [Salmonella enterica subsp. enterica serovar Carmel]|uniref:DUF4928 domain-containing protein n=1 Tax=Salmonella enterica TaxID=28901 RepID=A0A742XSE3_SALER|nr:DUF4928 domain-containing protein [Salmonella enterica subsp. enterica serovar Carmel]EBW4675918.1 DUF4928 domain-containing protein [Salmonella enterica subsp. salamae serovar Sofia]EDP8967058.1 DUF4928 domain-containing protein [Salmonella enterica subsp. enterica]EED7473268.1 DUF4928 domain-containing protein [Salmonella enterica subsp. salamae]HAF1734841.1 DUF4928 domain-containing protein [Salmonella enterica]
MIDLSTRLFEYQKVNRLISKGKLATMLFVSRLAVKKGLPLDPSVLVTDRKGQVQGLGKSAVQAILKEYNILRVLAEEGGRTSRGSLGDMQNYVNFLNELHSEGFEDTLAIEKWWVERVKDYFAAQPFVLRYDMSKSLRYIIRELIAQAFKRQKENPGTMYAGAVLQHLIGAKLSVVLGHDKVKNHGFSVADSVSSRSGDFVIDDVAIHITTAPGEALLRKCKRNLEAGIKPIIITTYSSLPGAESLADIQGIEGRVDIWEAEQFIAANIYELSQFDASQRKCTVERLIEEYNNIITSCETDPSLKIVIG